MRAGIFPGDGSEYPGMSGLISSYDGDALDIGFDVMRIDSSVLDDRLNAQISVYGVSAMLWEMFRTVADFSLVAGHSLGFYSALFAAGVIGREDGVGIVKKAYHAIREVSSESGGGMTAIIGLKWFIIDDICKKISKAFVANINSATQVVISGAEEALREAEKRAARAGALSVKRLTMNAPLHSPLMNGIGDIMGDYVKEMDFAGPRIPVVNHTHPEILSDVDGIKDVIREQLTRKVLWRDAVVFMIEKGAGEFVEVGPSDVLTKLVRWIRRDAVADTSEEFLDKLKIQYEKRPDRLRRGASEQGNLSS